MEDVKEVICFLETLEQIGQKKVNVKLMVKILKELESNQLTKQKNPYKLM